MLTRHHAFRIGCALLVIAGIGWLATNQRAQVEIKTASTLPESATATSPSQPVVLLNPDTAEPQFRDLLDQQRQLGPADREREDEIRRELQSLLTEQNAAKIVQSLSPEDLNSEFGLAALTRWAANDSLAATRWLAQQPAQSTEQTWTIAQAITQDPIALGVLSERFPAEPWREALLENASRAALVENPADAIQLAQQMQPGATRTQTLLMIADEWTLRDPAAAARWIGSEQDLPLRDELLSTAAAAQASTDPLGAFTRTFGISSAATFERSLRKITTMWTDYEPERARRFVTLIDPHPISPAP